MIEILEKKTKRKNEKPNLKAKIENPIYNRQGKIQKVNLKIENEFYTIEECRIIDFLKPPQKGIMLYEKTEEGSSKRLTFCEEYADVFLTKMIKAENFDALFRLEIYKESHLINGFKRIPFLIQGDDNFERVNSFIGMPIQKATTADLFYTQAETIRKMPEGDFYVGHFTDNGIKTADLFLRRESGIDRLSIHSIAEAEKAKAEYQNALKNCPFMDENGHVIPDKWHEYLKTKNQNTK